jgi:hypothetical protein
MLMYDFIEHIAVDPHIAPVDVAQIDAEAHAGSYRAADRPAQRINDAFAAARHA